MREIKLEEFRGIVKGLALRYDTVPGITGEDIEQELWIKVMEILPKTTHLEPGEREKFMKTVLRNRTRDLLRYVRVRRVEEPFSGMYDWDEKEVPFEELVTESILSLGVKLREDGGQTEKVSLGLLTRRLANWAWSHPDVKICRARRRLVRELVAPSDYCLKIWKKYSEERPSSNTANSDFSLPVVAKVLGVSEQNVRRNMKSLAQYLKKHNYTLEEAV